MEYHRYSSNQLIASLFSLATDEPEDIVHPNIAMDEESNHK